MAALHRRCYDTANAEVGGFPVGCWKGVSAGTLCTGLLMVSAGGLLRRAMLTHDAHDVALGDDAEDGALVDDDDRTDLDSSMRDATSRRLMSGPTRITLGGYQLDDLGRAFSFHCLILERFLAVAA